MRFPVSTRVILAIGAVPFIWTFGGWGVDLITRGYVWDMDEVWGVLECEWLGAPILLVGLAKLAFDNLRRRKAN